MSSETSFDKKKKNGTKTIFGTIRKKVFFRLFHLNMESDSFSISIEPKNRKTELKWTLWVKIIKEIHYRMAKTIWSGKNSCPLESADPLKLFKSWKTKYIGMGLGFPSNLLLMWNNRKDFVFQFSLKQYCLFQLVFEYKAVKRAFFNKFVCFGCLNLSRKHRK